MKELVEHVVRSLVDSPDQVIVDEIDEGNATRYELRVAQDDLGQVIGRQGRTARAIRALLDAAGLKDGRRYFLDIID
ncbi:MAG: KH domain-containing protein [Thermoanaerobaculia bacterium]|nr:KH domain-containing protein [Thermoanaerobaculia bacterium]